MKKEDSLAYKNPSLSKEWHPFKNGFKKPHNTSSGYEYKVWWKCSKGEDHEWEATVKSRHAGSGCPICSGYKVVKSNCLSTTHPEIAKEWHPTKNGNLKPKDFTIGSSTLIWWKCKENSDHVYSCKIKQRKQQKMSCPICNNRTVNNLQDLKKYRPDLIRLLHPVKNGNLESYFSVEKLKDKLYWWKCPKGDDHQWQDKIKNVSSRKDPNWCPICNYVKIVDSNSLFKNYPKVANQWHPTKNGDLTPKNIGPYNKSKRWWKCPEGDDHEWEDTVINRTRKKRGCKICKGQITVYSTSLIEVSPELADEWHPTKNGRITPLDVNIFDYKDYWWKCPKGDDHEWRHSVKDRISGGNCKVCSGIVLTKSNSLANTNPKLSLQWHQVKNGNLTPFDFTSRSGDKVWWKCPKGDDHIWEKEINRRVSGNGCPMCSGTILVKSNSLKFKYPEIAKEWHTTKNGTLTPDNIAASSSKKVWWKCPKGDDHVWQAQISNRTVSNTGCGVCSSRVVSESNCLNTVFPEIAKEWHPTKNGDLTPYDFVSGSEKKIWWKCPKGDEHVWQAEIKNRTSSNNTGCPFCTLTPQSREELIITHELILIFKKINPKGFKVKVKNKLWTIDIFIPELNLGIEFDGSHWHKDKRALDKLKTQELKEEGFNIIRIRQKPLERIFDNDVMAEKKYDGKEITNNLLKMIMKDFDLDKRTIRKIEDYIKNPDLQNEKGLDKYIEMILAEKNERKK